MCSSDLLAGLMGMASKFTECTLGVKYRNEYADGTVSGGPMYYLSKGMAERGFAGFGKVLAICFYQPDRARRLGPAAAPGGSLPSGACGGRHRRGADPGSWKRFG